MASDAGDKTESPTPRRRQEARESGQVPRSPDLTAALLLVGGMMALRWLGPALMQSMFRVLQEHLTVGKNPADKHIDVIPIVTSTAMAILGAAGPVMLALLILAALANILQIGFIFTTKSLELKLDRLNPITGLSRIFSMRSLIQLAMNLFKLAVVAYVAWSSLTVHLGELLAAMNLTGWPQLTLISAVCYEVGIRVALALLVLALIDYTWQRWKHEQDLRMTKEEVKEEMRRMEGDPIIKNRRRKMQLALALQHIRKNVPQADVIVTNPTELAIALKYDADSMTAPRVIAKGADYLAAKIREIAASHGIPIVERKPLAQAIFKTVEVGQEVPEEFYKAIAEILAYVYELSGKTRKPRNAAA